MSSGFLGFETSRLEAQLLRSLSSVMCQSHMSSMAWLCVRVWISDADNQRTGPRGLACFVSATGHPRGTVTAGGLDSAGSDSGGTYKYFLGLRKHIICSGSSVNADAHESALEEARSSYLWDSFYQHPSRPASPSSLLCITHEDRELHHTYPSDLGYSICTPQAQTR